MKINHDFHVHTWLSICSGGKGQGGELQGYLENARREGLKYLGMSDHFWDAGVGFEGLYVDSQQAAGVPHFYKTQNFEHILQLKEEIDHTDTGDVIVLFGAEGEYDPVHRNIAITEEVAERLDFLTVPNSHTHMMMDKNLVTNNEAHRDFQLQALHDILDCPMSRYLYSTAHPFEGNAEAVIRLMSDDDLKRVWTKCAEKNVAFEINTGTYKMISGLAYDKPETFPEQYARMISIAKDCGCKFVFGSDAHRTDRHDGYAELCDRISDAFGITEKDIAPMPKKK